MVRGRGVIYRGVSDEMQKTNATLISSLFNRAFTDPAIRDVLLSQDRQNYCMGGACYDDAPQPLSWGITISAPHMHARALSDLREKLRPGCSALDVGSGSGYLSVAMANLVGPSGRVVGIDHVADLVAWSIDNVRRDGKRPLLDSGRLRLLVADGFNGHPEGAPYDCIHVGAAPPTIPPALKQQLKPGGVLLLPVGPEGGEQVCAAQPKFVTLLHSAAPGPPGLHPRDALRGRRLVRRRAALWGALRAAHHGRTA